MWFPETAYTNNAIGDAPGGWIPVLQVVSHLIILVGVVYNFVRGHMHLATAGLVSLLQSIGYHLCRGAILCFLFDVHEWRKFDHTSVLNLAGAVALALLQYRHAKRKSFGSFAEYVLPFLCNFAVRVFPFDFRSYLVVIVFLLLVGLQRFIYASFYLEPPSLRQYGWRSLGLGLLFLLPGGILFFIHSGDPEGDTLFDGVTHIIWHLLSGIFYLCVSISLDREEK
jgi:hypothetical protein